MHMSHILQGTPHILGRSNLFDESFLLTPKSIRQNVYTDGYASSSDQNPDLGNLPCSCRQYTIVRWGCGAGAFMFFVVDAINGAVYEPPELCIALAGGEEDALPGFGNYNPSFSLNSKLLLTVGVVDGPKEDPYGRAKTVYLFDKGRFKRLYKEHAPQ